MHTCYYTGKEYRAMGSFLGEAASDLLAKYSVFPDWEGETGTADAYTPWHLTLVLNGDQLLLQQVRVKAFDEHYPPIAGVYPERPTATDRYARYDGLSIPLTGNGVLYLVKDQVWVDMCILGISGPYDYKTVLKIEIKEGAVIGIHDRSTEAEEDRRQRGPSPFEILISLVRTDKSYWSDLLVLLKHSGDWSPNDERLVSKMSKPEWVPNDRQATQLMEICSKAEAFGLANPTYNNPTIKDT